MQTLGSIATLLLVVATFVGSSSAAPAMTSPELCEYYGRIADMASSLRSQGVPSHAVIDYFRAQIRQASGPGITATGRETVDGMLTTIILTVYAHPSVSGPQAKLATFNTCMQRR